MGNNPTAIPAIRRTMGLYPDGDRTPFPHAPSGEERFAGRAFSGHCEVLFGGGDSARRRGLQHAYSPAGADLADATRRARTTDDHREELVSLTEGLADSYVGTIAGAVETIQADNPPPEVRTNAQRTKAFVAFTASARDQAQSTGRAGRAHRKHRRAANDMGVRSWDRAAGRPRGPASRGLPANRCPSMDDGGPNLLRRAGVDAPRRHPAMDCRSSSSNRCPSWTFRLSPSTEIFRFSQLRAV